MRTACRASLLLFFAPLSCGPNTDSPIVQQCIAQCEAAAECPEGSSDCDNTCVNELEEARQLECQPEYEAILDCTDTAKDLCDTGECATRISAYSSCLGEFCGGHPEDERCSEGGSG